jgi:hypothetical protein
MPRVFLITRWQPNQAWSREASGQTGVVSGLTGVVSGLTGIV